MCTAVGLVEATGRPPTRWPSPKDRGPFVYLVAEVLNLVGAAEDMDADDLVRRYGELTRADHG